MTLKIARLEIFPLKSAQGIVLPQAEITPRGLAHDRLWMLVDAQGIALTQRKGNGKLATVRPDLHPDGSLTFSAPGQAPLEISDRMGLTPYEKPLQVWDDACQALAAPAHASQWFSDYLGKPVTLLRFNDDSMRQVDLRYADPGDRTAFADGFPILIASQDSYDGMQSHFTAASGIERFRANIVWEGAEPFAEDGIGSIRIGGANGPELKLHKPCSRCEIPGIDQKTGAAIPDDMLKTLGHIRFALQNQKPGMFFGENAVPVRAGTVKVGDAIEILTTRPLGLTLRPKRPFYSVGMRPLLPL